MLFFLPRLHFLFKNEIHFMPPLGPYFCWSDIFPAPLLSPFLISSARAVRRPALFRVPPPSPPSPAPAQLPLGFSARLILGVFQLSLSLSTLRRGIPPSSFACHFRSRLRIQSIRSIQQSTSVSLSVRVRRSRREVLPPECECDKSSPASKNGRGRFLEKKTNGQY